MVIHRVKYTNIEGGESVSRYWLAVSKLADINNQRSIRGEAAWKRQKLYANFADRHSQCRL